MGNAIDYLPNGQKVIMIEIAPDDYKKWCVRSTKEMWIDFTDNTVKPCSFSKGVDMKNFEAFINYVEDINNNITRSECNYCHSINPNFRIQGNELWTTPDHGNCHVEFKINDSFNKKIINKYVKYIAKNYHKFACICVTGDEPGKKIVEQNHIELIAKPFYNANRLKNRGLRYDFKTNFDFTIEQTKEIVSYMKKMQKKYRGVLVNIQPSEHSVNNDFDKKIELFVKSNFEIVARSNVVKDKLEQHFLFDTMHLTLQI